MGARKYDYDTHYNSSTAKKLNEPLYTPQKSYNKDKLQNVNFSLRRRLLLIVATFVVFAFVMVVRSNALIQNGIMLVNLRKSEASYIKGNDLLKLEVSKLNSPQRINEIAQKKLGMIIAKNNLYIHKVKDNKGQSVQTIPNVD